MGTKSKHGKCLTISGSLRPIAHDLLAAGIFEKHRVNATSIYIDSESLMNHAIAGGSIQFTTSWIIFQ